jgi:putative FmdB family regulatory protein
MTYEYVCGSCGHQWEAEQSIKDKPLKSCVSCGENKAKRLVSGGTGFLLKGGGWYADLYGSPGAAKAAEDKAGAKGAAAAKADGSDSKPASDTKSDAKPSGESKTAESKSTVSSSSEGSTSAATNAKAS